MFQQQQRPSPAVHNVSVRASIFILVMEKIFFGGGFFSVKTPRKSIQNESIFSLIPPIFRPSKMMNINFFQKVRKTPTFVIKVGVLWWR